MAVYYKFKSAKDYDSISSDGHFISVANLKERIFESKHLGRGTDFDLVVTNAQTNEEYLDEAMLIPKNTSVLIRRVPGRPRMTIVAQPDEPKVEAEVVDDQHGIINFLNADSSVLNNFEASDFDDEFGNDLYATIPQVTAGQSTNLMQDSAPPTKADEDDKLKAFIESSGFDWQRQGDGFVQGRGFVRGGRGGRGFGRGGGGAGSGLANKMPPQGYVCHRCKVPGHFIQHCPTNGDPAYDVRKVKPPTGIPASMLVPTPDGLYSLPSGTSAVLKPNEAAFEREIEGLPSTRSMGGFPPELHCPLCKEVMKDAVLTSKCCFRSFCDKCIRDHVISKSMCICGATNILADDLLPNKTVRDTINRIMESGNSSADNVGSAVHIQDMESARCPPPKIPSSTRSAASKGEQKLVPDAIDSSAVKETVSANKVNDVPMQQLQPQNSAKEKIIRVPDVSEATHESASVKEHVSQSSVLPVEEVQQKVAAVDAGKKKKKKKVPLLPNGQGPEMPWMGGMQQQPMMDGYGVPANFNPYWQGPQPPMDGFNMGPFPGNMPFNMGYGPGPMDMPFANGMPMDPFVPPNFMYPGHPMMHPPIPPRRDLAAEFGMGMNFRPPFTREEFEARQADLRRKRDMEKRFEKELPRDRDFREGSSSANAFPMKSKPMLKPPPVRRSPSPDRYYTDRERERDRAHDRHRERERSRERFPLDHDRQRERERSRDRPSVDIDRQRERERSRDRSSLDIDLDNDSHHRRSSLTHRSDRASPTCREKEIPRPPPTRKPEHHELDHDIDCPRERERVHERERSYRHRSESGPPATAAELASAQAALDKKHKASVFSRISFPEEEQTKKRKASDEPKPKSKSVSKDHEAGSGSHHHKKTGSSSSAANGYHHHHDHQSVKKSVVAAMEYESSDDERHFKRKPSRYEPSPLPRKEWVDADEAVGRRHRKHL